MSKDAPLKIMYLNPVGTADFDDVFADMARDHKLPGTEVHITSLNPAHGGYTHIEFRSYEAIVTTGIIRATRVAQKEGFDALAIGCFYDTGLHDAREVSGEMPVTAPCTASLEIASSLANRFGIIVGRRKWVHQMNENVVLNGKGPNLCGFYHVELGVNEFQVDHDRTNTLLMEAGRKAIDEDYAEALILGCTLEIGFFRKMSEELGVPVIDPALSALKRAEYSANLKRACGWIPSRKWSCEAPPEAEIELFGLDSKDEVFGNRVVVEAR